MKKFIKYKLDQERALTPSEPPASPALSSFCPPPEHLTPPPPPPPPPSSPDIDSNVFLKREILDFGIRGRIIIQNATTADISTPGEHFVPICRDFIRGNCYRNGNCKFAHRSGDVFQMMKVYTFCHQFQNSVCSYVDCRFVHASIFDQIKFYKTGILPSEALAHRANSDPAMALLLRPQPMQPPLPPLPPLLSYWSPSLPLLPPPPPLPPSPPPLPMPPLSPSPSHQSQSSSLLLPPLPPLSPSPSSSRSPPPLPPLYPSPLVSPPSTPSAPSQPTPPPPLQLLTALSPSSRSPSPTLLPKNSSKQLPLEHVFKVPALPPLRKRTRSNRSDTSRADTSSTKRQRTQKAKHSFCPFPECSEDSDDDSSPYSTLNSQHDKDRHRQQRPRRKINIAAPIITKSVRILLTPLSPTLCKWLEERTDSRLPPDVVTTAAAVGTH